MRITNIDLENNLSVTVLSSDDDKKIFSCTYYVKTKYGVDLVAAFITRGEFVRNNNKESPVYYNGDVPVGNGNAPVFCGYLFPLGARKLGSFSPGEPIYKQEACTLQELNKMIITHLFIEAV